MPYVINEGFLRTESISVKLTEIVSIDVGPTLFSSAISLLSGILFLYAAFTFLNEGSWISPVVAAIVAYFMADQFYVAKLSTNSGMLKHKGSMRELHKMRFEIDSKT